MDKEFYGYKRMHQCMGESLRNYSLSELNGLANVLRKHVKGDIADGMIAYIDDVASAKQEKLEQMEQTRDATEALYQRMYGRRKYVPLRLL